MGSLARWTGWQALAVVLVLSGLVACGQGGGPPATTPAPGAGGDVQGWVGAMVPLCSMSQFQSYFRRADGEGYGIRGANAEAQALLDRALCEERTTIKVWGRLDPETIDYGGRRIEAERVAIVESYAPPVAEKEAGQEAVEGWEGRVLPTCRQTSADNFFERQDGRRFGIAAELPELKEALYPAECEGYAVRIWGTLYKGVDDYRGTRIVIERMDKAP